MNDTIKHLANNIKTDSTSYTEAFSRLYDVLKVLRSPDGCPWDQNQTQETFYKNLIEESYEYIHAWNKNDLNECEEELGDIFLVTIMLSIMHEETNHFTLKNILDTTSKKLIRRHPHVFKKDIEYQADNPDEVVTLWDSIKENVEGKKTKKSDAFSKIQDSLPTLLQSVEIQKKAAKQGFNWNSTEGILDKIHEEIRELDEELSQENKNNKKITEEFGDILFTLVNFAKYTGINPDEALFLANQKFKRRYNAMRDLMEKEGLKENSPISLEEMDVYWNRIKNSEIDI